MQTQYDFFDSIKERVKIIRVPLNQFCYIVPPVVILSKYFKIEFYYIDDDTPNGINESCYQNFSSLNMITTDNLFHTTQKEFTSMILSDVSSKNYSVLYYVSSRKQPMYPVEMLKHMNYNCFSVTHGVDEEDYLKVRKHRKVTLDYYLFQALTYKGLHIENKFDEIYQIDNTKKTIILEDTSLTFCHDLRENDHLLLKYQNNMIDQLIELKQRYNVVVRLHPQYHQFKMCGADPVAKRFRDNFIIDYTQIPLIDQYNRSDLIIFHRATSSGFQGVFCEELNMLCLDLDFDGRKKGLLYRNWYIRELTNADIKAFVRDKHVLHDEIVHIQEENNMDIVGLVERLEEKEFKVDEDMRIKRRQHLIEKMDVDVSPENTLDHTLNEKIFLLYVLTQFTHFVPICKKLVDETKVSLSGRQLMVFNKVISELVSRNKISW